MWSVVSHGFKADLLSLLEMQTFKLKENNVTNMQILKTLCFHMIFFNPAVVPWGLCDPRPL